MLPAGHAAAALSGIQPLVELTEHHVVEFRAAAVQSLKQIAKTVPDALREEAGGAGLGQFVVPLLAAVKSPDMRVKMHAERGLVYALQIHTRPATLENFVANHPDAAIAKHARDYSRRVLVRVKEDSDDEQ